MSAKLRCEIFPDDLDAAVDFYVRVLGFALDRDERAADQPYVSMSYDNVQIGASVGTAAVVGVRRPPIGVELVIEVDDIELLHARVAATAWPIDEQLQRRYWGLRDFRLLDPSGYYLRLTEH
jgi:catechol 2,3-dioxygenase-like lactoylglutathione lyase family enzyme